MQSASMHPPYSVLIADDSAVARAYMAKIVARDPLFTLRGSAANGEIAIKSLLLSMQDTPIDIIILDIDMPIMDGLEALPKLLEISPNTQIIVATTVGAHHAETSAQVLNQGAKDFILKPSNGSSFANAAKFQQDLLEKMRTLVHTQATKKPSQTVDLTNFVARSSSVPIKRQAPNIVKDPPPAAAEPVKSPSVQAVSPASTFVPPTPKTGQYRSPARKDPAAQSPSAPAAAPIITSLQASPIVLPPNHPAIFKNRPAVFAIGCSTGGPQALVALLQELKPLQHMPAFLTQHMPPAFTKILAEQISQQTPWQCIESSDGMVVENGKLYIAAGDYHLIATKQGSHVCMSLSQDPPENFCRPAVDPMLRSLINVYGARNMVTLILTGMGQDGLLGCQQVVQGGGVVIAQDEKSSVVWGMPGAVAKAGICQAVLPLNEIAAYINQAMGKQQSL